MTTNASEKRDLFIGYSITSYTMKDVDGVYLSAHALLFTLLPPHPTSHNAKHKMSKAIKYNYL